MPSIDHLRKLKMPVLVSYGTNDAGSAPLNDYLRVEMIRTQRKNFSFSFYFGTEHNYFGVNKDGTTNWDAFNWDRVALDWLHWLQQTGIAR